MKKLVPLAILALSLAVLTACSTGPSKEELKQAAADACEVAVKDHAKYPREAELIDPIEGAVIPVDYDQGPEGTTQYSVNFGVAAFKNAFGVASDYNYGCVSYHDETGKVLDTQVLVKEDNNILSGVTYRPTEDKLG